jgi:hypothetical protein
MWLATGHTAIPPLHMDERIMRARALATVMGHPPILCFGLLDEVELIWAKDAVEAALLPLVWNAVPFAREGLGGFSNLADRFVTPLVDHAHPIPHLEHMRGWGSNRQRSGSPNLLSGSAGLRRPLDLSAVLLTDVNGLALCRGRRKRLVAGHIRRCAQRAGSLIKFVAAEAEVVEA